MPTGTVGSMSNMLSQVGSVEIGCDNRDMWKMEGSWSSHGNQIYQIIMVAVGDQSNEKYRGLVEPQKGNIIHTSPF